MLKAFGKNPTGKILAEVKKSPNYREGIFQNIEPTVMMKKDVSFFKIIRDMLNRPKDVAPAKPIPAIAFDASLIGDDTVPQIVWFGHSGYLIAYKGKRILVDPVFQNASPVSFIGKPFKGTEIFTADKMPDIDVLVITHDHYDHMEYKTLMKLKSRIKKIVCSAGVQSHLLYWGFDKEIITALDWNTSATVDGIDFTALPARHFSGRLLKRNKTLWNSYAMQMDSYKLFIGGDSGYGTHFKTIGDTHGPFDIAFIECGQYGINWPDIHMMPEQTAQAAVDIKAKILLPVHWAKFTLALHPWNEPIKRLLKTKETTPLDIVSPRPGEIYALGKEYTQQEWWQE